MIGRARQAFADLWQEYWFFQINVVLAVVGVLYLWFS